MKKEHKSITTHKKSDVTVESDIIIDKTNTPNTERKELNKSNVNNNTEKLIHGIKENIKKKKDEEKSISIVDCKQTCLNPINIDFQQKSFFESYCTLNPIFTYDNISITQKILSQYQTLKSDLLDIAKGILDDFINEYGSESRYIKLTEGELLTKEDTKQIFTEYIRSLGLENNINLAFVENTVSPTAITHDSKGKSTIIIGLPIEYRRNRIQGVLDHEIGTHYIRKYNDSFQIWAGPHRKRYLSIPCIVTEEGLASINQLVNSALNKENRPLLFRAALYYYSAYKASQLSFVDLYKDLERYIDNPERRFRACLRVKRGLSYTDKPGGMYKDQVYLEGAVMLLRKRNEINFDHLYSGKIALENLEKLNKVIKTVGMKLPWFLKNKKMYLKALDRIAEVNHII